MCKPCAAMRKAPRNGPTRRRGMPIPTRKIHAARLAAAMDAVHEPANDAVQNVENNDAGIAAEAPIGAYAQDEATMTAAPAADDDTPNAAHAADQPKAVTTDVAPRLVTLGLFATEGCCVERPVMATISVVGCSSLLDEEAEHAASIGDMPSAASLDLSPPMVMASLGSINFMRIPTEAAVEYLYNDFGIGGYGCDLLVEVKDVCSGGSTDTAAALSVHMRAPTMMPMADEPVLVKPTPGTPGFAKKQVNYIECDGWARGAHSCKVQVQHAKDNLGYLDGSLKQRRVAFAAKACGVSAR